MIYALVFLAGFVDSIAGGGGLISLPAYAAFGLAPHAAIATNKFSSTFGTGVAVHRYWRAGAVRARTALLAALGSLAGSVAGARTVLHVPAETVGALLFVLVPAALAVALFQERLRAALRLPGVTGRAADAAAAGIGLAIGFYDGFFGPGTGTFLTLAFAVVLGWNLLHASAAARLANLASNAGGLTVFLLDGRVVFPLAYGTALAGIAGNFLGARLALANGPRIIRPVLVGVLAALLLDLLLNRG